MVSRKSLLLPLAVVLCIGVSACSDDDVTGTGGALARIEVDAPDTASSGQTFTVDVMATAIGVENVRNGSATVTIPQPLTVVSVSSSPGTQVSFANGNPSTVTWTLNTLDSNTSSTVSITLMGTLPAGSPDLALTIQASMVADGISSGELVADDELTLTQ